MRSLLSLLRLSISAVTITNVYVSYFINSLINVIKGIKCFHLIFSNKKKSNQFVLSGIRLLVQKEDMVLVKVD